jgi:hypothetical protein
MSVPQQKKKKKKKQEKREKLPYQCLPQCTVNIKQESKTKNSSCTPQPTQTDRSLLEEKRTQSLKNNKRNNTWNPKRKKREKKKKKKTAT